MFRPGLREVLRHASREAATTKGIWLKGTAPIFNEASSGPKPLLLMAYFDGGDDFTPGDVFEDGDDFGPPAVDEPPVEPQPSPVKSHLKQTPSKQVVTPIKRRIVSPKTGR